MSIEALPNSEFEAITGPTVTGLVGTIGVQIVAGDDVHVPRTTAGIVEEPPGSGIYIATLIAPNFLGLYEIRWDNGADPPLYALEGLTVTGENQLVPTIDEVAALLRQRTRSDVTGDEVGTFTADTRPTDAEVAVLITTAVDLVSLRLGTRIPASAISTARMAITLRTAMLIELRLQATRTDEADSVYTRLKTLYDELMRDLEDSLLDLNVATTSRVGSMSIVSPTLAHLPDTERQAAQGPYV